MFCDWQMSCRCRAIWVVGVGTRAADRQSSCGKHLAMTCRAMYEAENRPNATLTLVSARQ